MTPGARSERQWRPRGKEGGVNRKISDHHALDFQIGGRSIDISASGVAGIGFSEFSQSSKIVQDGEHLNIWGNLVSLFKVALQTNLSPAGSFTKIRDRHQWRAYRSKQDWKINIPRCGPGDPSVTRIEA